MMTRVVIFVILVAIGSPSWAQLHRCGNSFTNSPPPGELHKCSLLEGGKPVRSEFNANATTLLGVRVVVCADRELGNERYLCKATTSDRFELVNPYAPSCAKL